VLLRRLRLRWEVQEARRRAASLTAQTLAFAIPRGLEEALEREPQRLALREIGAAFECPLT
jgi:hypothetical protein